MKLKNLTKTKTIICANLYDSMFYQYETSNSNFINACLQLCEEFPNTFKVLESSFVHVKIAVSDLKHCFELYKYNEDKVIYRAKI